MQHSKSKGVEIVCPACGVVAVKPTKEFNRSTKLGRRMYCSYACFSSTVNAARKIPDQERLCAYCAIPFITSGGAKSARFCSRSCASRGSVTTRRRRSARSLAKQNFIPATVDSAARVLKQREAWRYRKLKTELKKRSSKFEFEYVLDGRVFDLALFDQGILVEFDGPYHSWSVIAKKDLEKDRIAERNGYRLLRYRTSTTEEIEAILVNEWY